MVRRARIPRIESPSVPNSQKETHVSDQEKWTQKSLKEMADKSGKQQHEYLAHGGDQVVLQVRETREGRPEGIREKSVIKVTQRFVSEGIVKEVLRSARPEELEKLDPRMKERAEKGLAEEAEEQKKALAAGETYDANEDLRQEVERAKEYERTLRKYFPPENVLRSRVYLRKVPISKGAAQEVLNRYGYGALEVAEDMEVPTMIRIQSRIPEEVERLANDISSVSFSYMEGIIDMMPGEQDQLDRMGFDETTEIDLGFAQNILDRGTIALLTEAEQDQELKSVMQDFVERTMKLANEGGEMIDIAGGGNVKFFRDGENEWQYLIIDPDAHRDWNKLKHNLEALLQETNEEALEKMRVDDQGTEEEVKKKRKEHREQMYKRYDTTLNGVNFARTMNILAKALGMSERIQILDEVGSARSKYEVLVEVHNYNQKTFRGKTRRMKRVMKEGGRERYGSTESETFVPESETMVRGRPAEIVANMDDGNNETMDPAKWVIEGEIDEDAVTEEVVTTPREAGLLSGEDLEDEIETDENETIWNF
jgi:hypothetical protein